MTMSHARQQGDLKGFLRAPLAIARGYGSAKTGTEHWWAQRMTSIALVPLGVWFALSVALMPSADLAVVKAWIGNPCNTALLLLFIGVGCHHASAGLDIIMEDYIHCESAKLICVIGQRMLLLLLAVTCMAAVLKVAFGG